MTIRFLLPEDASERVAFVYSPLLEAVLSLHVLDEPKHHPYQHGWVRRARSLPPGLKAEIRALGLLCRSPLPGFLLPTSAGELAGFSGELAAMGELPAEVVATELRHIHDCHTREPKPAPENPNGPREPGRRRTIPRTTEQQPVDPDVASLILDDPPGLIERLQALKLLICDGTPGQRGIRVSCAAPSLLAGRGGPSRGSRWSARSAARTNDLDAGEECRRIGQRRKGAACVMPWASPCEAWSAGRGSPRAGVQPYLGARTRVRQHDG